MNAASRPIALIVDAQRGNAPIVRILDRIAPGERNDAAHFTVDGKPGAGSPIRLLLRPELARGTALLWLAFFMSMLVIYLLSSWLPTLLRSTGVSLTTAALMTIMFQVGGTLGAICLGWLMDRFDPHRVLFASYLLAALFIALIGRLASDPVLAGALVFCAGVCVAGGQVGANAVSADFYPTDCRATGVAWAQWHRPARRDRRLDGRRRLPHGRHLAADAVHCHRRPRTHRLHGHASR